MTVNEYVALIIMRSDSDLECCCTENTLRDIIEKEFTDENGSVKTEVLEVVVKKVQRSPKKEAEEATGTVINLTPEQLEYFNDHRMPNESLSDAINRIVTAYYTEKRLTE